MDKKSRDSPKENYLYLFIQTEDNIEDSNSLFFRGILTLRS